MTSFFILCLVIAVVWLIVRANTLADANEDVRSLISVLGQRLQRIEEAQKLAEKARIAAPVAAQVASAIAPAPPAASGEPDLTLVAPPEVPESALQAELVEPRLVDEVLAVEMVPIAPAALDAEVEHAPTILTERMRSVLAGLEAATKTAAVPPPLPPPLPPPATVTAPQWGIPISLESTESAPEAASQHAATPAPAPAPEAPSAPPQSFELRLGTYWFVRVGVVILLTGLVFLANIAYTKWVPQLGPAGKLSLLYLASGALLGAGAWLQRKAAQASLNNFAHVLLAGGLGAVYFTTYAAHHYEPLRVIGSAALDGGLLLAWAGFIVWLADRKKSETLALFALGLGYYTAVVTRVGTFTLYSNLVLTVATVFFLVRNRWAHLTLAGLVASYGGFAFWRFFHDGHWLLRAPVEELTLSAVFLAGYWVCFTAATFLAETDLLADKRRAAFLSANNGAFFALVTLSMAAARGWEFWQFCLGFGAVLLGLAAFARTRLPEEPSVRAAYLTQGLLLVTLGLVTKFSGQQLAVLLAAESVVLLTLGCRQPSRLLRAGAFVTAALAVGWLVLGWETGQPVALGIGVAGLLLFDAWWMGRHEDALLSPAEAQASTMLVRPRTTWLSLLALVAGAATILQHADRLLIPVWLMGAGLLLTLSVHVLRTREIAIFVQGYLFLAHCYQMLGGGEDHWRSVFLLVGSLVLLHWWTRQTVLGDAKLRAIAEGGYAAAVVALLYTWLHGHFSEPHWLLVTSGLALVVTGYGALTRAWRLAAAGQFFALVAAAGFARHLQAPHPEWAYALAPIAMLMIASTAAHCVCARRMEPDDGLRTVLRVVTAAYQWVALGMVVVMVFGYVPVAQRPWTFALLGGAAFGLAGWLRASQPLLASGVLLCLGLLALLAPRVSDGTLFSVPNLLAVLLPLALQQVARRMPERFPVPANAHAVVLLASGGFLWLHLTRWLEPERDGHFFTVAWSVLGPVFFAVGVWLRERTYLVLGLGCLVAALFRVVTHDVWQPELFALNLLPMFAVLALQRVARKHPDGTAVPDAAHMAAIGISGLSLWLFLTRWLMPERNGDFLTVSWSVLGPVFIVAGVWLRERTYHVLGLFCLGAALARVVFHDTWQQEIFALNLLPMFAVFALQRIARRHADGAALPDAAHTAAILASGLSLWLFLSRWVVQASGGKFFLTASWAALALLVFGAGFAMRERVYRWLGLAVLAGALGRVVLLDVLQLALVYRVLSFMALGIALIVLGYVYNRWQDKIREWL